MKQKVRTITRKIPARTIRSYQCLVCKTKYRHKKLAEKCADRVLEKINFNIGDQVKINLYHICNIDEKSFYPKGRVVKILGPMLPDEEYERKWFGGYSERLNSHIFQYEVAFYCVCDMKRSGRYFLPEISLWPVSAANSKKKQKGKSKKIVIKSRFPTPEEVKRYLREKKFI